MKADPSLVAQFNKLDFIARSLEILAVAFNGSQEASREAFTRHSEDEARMLAAELEKEGRIVTIDGQPFLNSAGPDGLYLHQASAPCPLCGSYYGCMRCESDKGEYYSVKPTHYHSRKIEGVSGYTGIHDILCYECNRKDRFEVYGPSYGEAVA